jgi:hypothetical protein
MTHAAKFPVPTTHHPNRSPNCTRLGNNQGEQMATLIESSPQALYHP